MQYNAYQYNASEFNLISYDVNLFDSVTESDEVLKMPQIVRTDSQGTADALSDGFSLAAMMDTVTIYQRASTPFAYNNGRYNDFMYNIRADEDEILLMPTKALPDTVTITDVMASFSIEHILSDTLTSTDGTVAFMATSEMVEVVVLDEIFRLEVTNKALNETLRINDWLTIKQRPQSDNWGD